MKYIKYTVALILFVVGFIATGERFVYHLSHFEETFTQISFEYSLYGQDGENEIVKQNLRQKLNDYSLDVYYIETRFLSDYQEIRTIYGTDGALANLSGRGIIPQEYHSFFSGDTEIVFKSFDEIHNIFDIPTFYVVGSLARAAEFKNITEKNPYYRVDDFKGVSGSDEGLYVSLILIWGIVFSIIVMLTLYQGVLRKKEVFIKLTLGEMPNKYFMKNSLVDTVVYAVLFFSIAIMYASSSPIMYKFEFIVVVFVIMVVVNTGIHFICTRVRLKDTLSNSKGSGNLMRISYFIKTLSVLLSCFILSANAIVITEAIDYFGQEKVLKTINGYANYNISIVDEKWKDMSDETLWDRLNKKFGEDAIWMVDVSDFYLHNAVILNENAISVACSHVSKDLAEQLQRLEKNRLYMFLPEKQADHKDVMLATDMTKVAFLKHDSDEVLQTGTYSGRTKVLGINRKTNLYGSRFLENPIIIVDTRSTLANGNYANAMYTAREVLYRIDKGDFQAFMRSENINTSNCSIRVTNVNDSYEYYKTTLSKGLTLLLVVSLFVLVLEILMILLVVRLEYIVNGMEIAIRKTLGYTKIARVKQMIIITIVSIITCAVSMAIIMSVLSYGNAMFTILWGVVLLTIELTLILLEVFRIDKVQVPLILKGANL